MQINSFPNNSAEYYGAEEVMHWLHGRSSGVYAAGNNCDVAPVTGAMAVTVSDGLGWMANAAGDGVAWWLDLAKTSGQPLRLDIDPADTALGRIDRVIVEWKTTDFADPPEIKILQGSLASSPQPPALTRSSTVQQISLARVSVPAGITALTSANITDERMDSSVCGLASAGLEIPTGTVTAQINALIEQLQAAIAEVLSGAVPDGAITPAKLSGPIPLTSGGTGAANGAQGLLNLLASGTIVLQPGLHYGDAWPTTDNVEGRLFLINAEML